MSDPVLCPSCRRHLIFAKARGTEIRHWLCLYCGMVWSVEYIQKYLEETEHPLKDTVSG